MARLHAVVIAIVVLLAGCAADADPQVEQAEPAVDEAPTAEPAGEDTGTDDAEADGDEVADAEPVGGLDAVRAAVVRIEAEGTFVDPEIGLQQNAAGSGSGFIIDPSGIAVTNNHVVTGAALLRVHIEGEDRPRNARLLGYSECSDLAVIDIDGEDLPYLSWYGDEPGPGLDVYTAGFPLGDPEFTLTRGIVSKARADGESTWASVNHVLEHDATINPGNSGGPLVTADGQVVGVNYAAAAATNQYFAIGAVEAGSLIDRLRNGENVNSIGINGQAVTDGADLSGVWVASVASGSPADRAGVQPGDIITSLERLVLATDGTMADFCDILRSRSTSDPMSIEVLRFASQEVLVGQLNGDPLALSFSFADELADEIGDQAPPGASYDYTVITDDTGSISLEVPTTWADIDGTPFVFEGNQIFDVRASSDLEAFATTWTTPGVIVSASVDLARNANELAMLELVGEGFAMACFYEGRFPYADPLYTGQYDLYTDCDGTGVTYVIVGAVPADRSAVIAVQVQVSTDRDLEALDRVLASFVVNL